MYSKVTDILVLMSTNSLLRKRVTKGHEDSMLFQVVILGHVVVFTLNTQRRSHRGEFAEVLPIPTRRREDRRREWDTIHTYILFICRI